MLSKIRNACASDLDRIVALNYDSSWQVKDYEQMLHNDNYYFKVCTFNGVLIGFLTAQLSFDFNEVLQVCVDDQFRKKGYASLLFDDFICMSLNKEIFLDVNVKNEAALKLYTKKGFKEISRRKKYYNYVDDAIIMKREAVIENVNSRNRI